MSRGDGGLESWTDERQPNSGRIALTKWRSEVEHEVLGSKYPKLVITDIHVERMVHGW